MSNFFKYQGSNPEKILLSVQYLLITLQINKKMTVSNYYWFYSPILVIEISSIIYCLVKLIWVRVSKDWTKTGRSEKYGCSAVVSYLLLTIFWAVLLVNTLYFISNSKSGELSNKTLMIVLTIYLLVHGFIYGLVRMFNHVNLRRM